jgi:PPOX class probable F420-dependent enzyme
VLDDGLLTIVASGRMGSLATIKRDGRAQMSVVSYAHFPEEGLLRISTTAARSKARNLGRDPRASLLILSPDVYKFAVVESTAALSQVAASPDDDAVEELVTTYRRIAGEHPDWDEFRAAMVADQRLVVRLPIERLYGQG